MAPIAWVRSQKMVGHPSVYLKRDGMDIRGCIDGIYFIYKQHDVNVNVNVNVI